MKKLKRIFICLVLVVFLTLCGSVLYSEFKLFNIFEKIKADPTLLIPIQLSVFGVFSLLFNLEKFKKTVFIETTSYKILRIGDTIFCLSLFIILVVGIYYFSIVLHTNLNSFNFYLIRGLIIVLLLCFNFLIFIDNLKYHKTKLKSLKTDFIDEIGQ